MKKAVFGFVLFLASVAQAGEVTLTFNEAEDALLTEAAIEANAVLGTNLTVEQFCREAIRVYALSVLIEKRAQEIRTEVETQVEQEQGDLETTFESPLLLCEARGSGFCTGGTCEGTDVCLTSGTGCACTPLPSVTTTTLAP